MAHKHKTQTDVKAELAVNPTTLDAALEMIATMRDLVEAMETELKEAVAEKESAEEYARESNEAYSALEDQIEMTNENIIELARIHQKLKCGRYQEAIGDLDRVLQDVDSGGALRGGAVAVML
jgi:chromosome segregation ATPase